jgi:branched-chain amino acid transport system substrate-binding protein
VREALAAFNDVTFWGPVKFGPTGQIDSLEPPVFQIQKGKPTVIHPAAIQQGELRLGVK